MIGVQLKFLPPTGKKLKIKKKREVNVEHIQDDGLARYASYPIELSPSTSCLEIIVRSINFLCSITLDMHRNLIRKKF